MLFSFSAFTLLVGRQEGPLKYWMLVCWLWWFDWRFARLKAPVVQLSPPLPAPCGLRGCKNGPAPFPGQMSYKATKPGLVCLSYLSMLYYCKYCGLLGPFLCSVNFSWYVFCLLVVLAKLSLLAKWLARKTPLRKPNHGEGIISIKPRPESVHDFLGSHASWKVLDFFLENSRTWKVL